MRNLDIILKEIVELSEIKSAYNHYLSSHRSLTEVENTTQIKENKKTTIATLKILNKEKVEVKQAVRTFAERQITVKILNHTKDEKNAILHFNQDKRFRITE